MLWRLNPIELAANAFNAASIFLAARNSLHMWWTTIIGCLLFAHVFYGARLYADVTLQAFFVGSAAVGGGGGCMARTEGSYRSDTARPSW
jgi:nicotinamide mononucleotide transporter